MELNQVITHVMEPVLPGALAVLTVAGAQQWTRVYATPLENRPSRFPGDGATREHRGTLELPVAQRVGECLTVEIPAVAYSVWAFHLEPRLDPDFTTVNAPRLDWVFPSHAVPGEELRLQGRNLVSADHYPTVDPAEPVSFGGLLEGGTRVVAKRVGENRYIDIPVSCSSAYEARCAIPADLPEGDYDFYAHNGLGGAYGWSPALQVTVRADEAWPAEVFRVDDYTEPGEARYRDGEFPIGNGTADAAIKRALAALTANGGGVLEFSAGRYIIGETIVLPPCTVLRGAGSERTLIQGAMRGGLGPYVFITGDRDFTVEDVELHSIYAPLLIVAPTLIAQTSEEAYKHGFTWSETRARNVTVRRCRLSQSLLQNHDRRGDTDDIAKMQDFVIHGAHQDSHASIEAMLLRGDDIVVEDNVVLGGGSCVMLPGSRSVRVSRNRLGAGAAGHALYFSARLIWGAEGAKIDGAYCREIIAEDNDIYARCIMARDLFYFTYGGENAHVARNHIHDIETTYDGEMLGFHLWMARWKEPTIRMFGPTTAEIIDPTGEVAHEWLEGAVLDIVDGRGAGQMRRIVQREGNRIKLDRPWAADPDETSNIVFTAPTPFHNIVVVDNRITDGGSNIIFWGCSNDIVIDGNRCARGSGIQVWSVRMDADQKVWGGAAFTSVINNVYFSGHACPTAEDPLLAYGNGVIGIPCCAAYDCTTEGYDILGYLAHNNCTRDNSGIVIKTTYSRTAPDGQQVPWPIHHAGIVVEGNYAKDSIFGVMIEEEANAVERNNRAENVRVPVIWLKGGTV
ncbi:MAG: hypothetical protein ACYC6A_19680 [Armatimonadota bacterium]